MMGPTLATMVVAGAVGERVVDVMGGSGSWSAKTIERLEYFGALKKTIARWFVAGFGVFLCLQNDGRKSGKN